MSKDLGSSICVGLVEEDMELKELGSKELKISIESDNLIYIQKLSKGTLFVDVQGMIKMIFFVSNWNIFLNGNTLLVVLI